MGRNAKIRRARQDTSLTNKNMRTPRLRTIPLAIGGLSVLLAGGLYLHNREYGQLQIQPTVIQEQTTTTETASVNYDSINSLDKLVVNNNYRTLSSSDTGNSIGVYGDLFLQWAAQHGVQLPVSNLKIQLNIQVSALPNNVAFSDLEQRLNMDISNFAQYLSSHKKLADIKKKKHHARIIFDNDELINLPYSDNDGIVQIYLTNSSRKSLLFSGTDKFGNAFNLPLLYGTDTGGTGLKLSLKQAQGNTYLTAEPNLIYVALNLSEKENRYYALLSSVLSEYLHSSLIDTEVRNISELAKRQNPILSLQNVNQVYSYEDGINEGVVHATVLLYLESILGNKSLVKTKLSTYSQLPKYGLVSEFYAAVHELPNELRLQTKLLPALPLVAYLEGFPYLEQGREGLKRFALEMKNNLGITAPPHSPNP